MPLATEWTHLLAILLLVSTLDCQSIRADQAVSLNAEQPDEQAIPNNAEEDSQVKRVTLRPQVTKNLLSETRNQTSYIGTIGKVADGRLQVKAQKQEGRSSVYIPWVSENDWLRRNFVSNTGVGSEPVNKEVWIDLQNIYSIEDAE